MRLAYFNMTEPGVSCPTSLRQIETPAKLCGRPGTVCYGVTFPADSIRYSKVCGQARGYQYCSPDAFGHSSIFTYLPFTVSSCLDSFHRALLSKIPSIVHHIATDNSFD